MMKKVVLLTIVLTLGIFSASILPSSAVVIYQNGFNTDTDGNGVADGWNAQEPGSGSYSMEPDNKVEGAFSQFLNPPAWKGIYSDPIAGIVAGQTYTVSYWIYTGWNRSVQIWGDGMFGAYPMRTINTGGQWVYCEDTVVASANPNPAQVYITAVQLNLPILVDDMKIDDGTQVPEPSAILALAAGLVGLTGLRIRRRS